MSSKKRPAPNDDNDQSPDTLPSPSLSTITTPLKRPRLDPAPIINANNNTNNTNNTPSTSLLSTLTSTPPTPPTPAPPPANPTRKSALAADPLNTSIYALRIQGLAWDAIAARTNAACHLSADQELTPAACYSRVFRNGPLVARARGEGWERGWFVRMKGPVEEGGDDPDGGKGEQGGDEGRMGKVVMEAVERVKAGFWVRVVEVVREGLGDGREVEEEQVKAVYERVIADGE